MIDHTLNIWSELEEARMGINSYGGSTAEIYVYRLIPYEPSLHTGQFDAQIELKAARSLHRLLTKFQEKYKVTILVDGVELGPWLLEQGIEHRCHVTVEK